MSVQAAICVSATQGAASLMGSGILVKNRGFLQRVAGVTAVCVLVLAGAAQADWDGDIVSGFFAVGADPVNYFSPPDEVATSATIFDGWASEFTAEYYPSGSSYPWVFEFDFFSYTDPILGEDFDQIWVYIYNDSGTQRTFDDISVSFFSLDWGSGDHIIAGLDDTTPGEPAEPGFSWLTTSDTITFDLDGFYVDEIASMRFNVTWANDAPPVVPAPAPLVLLGIGMAGVALRRRFRRP